MFHATFHRTSAALTAFAAITTFTLAAMVSPPALAADPSPVVAYSKQGKFQDVRDDLKLAIEGKGLVIDYQSHVNDMLERTGKDVGSARKLYHDAEGFVFCSASLSRKMMEADMANIAMCPYTMMVYATAQEPTKVHVTYRRPWRPDGSAASKAVLKEVAADEGRPAQTWYTMLLEGHAIGVLAEDGGEVLPGFDPKFNRAHELATLENVNFYIPSSMKGRESEIVDLAKEAFYVEIDGPELPWVKGVKINGVVFHTEGWRR